MTFKRAGSAASLSSAATAAPVVCLHGVPASSFLYRKVLTELAHPGGCAAWPSTSPVSDWPERPSDFDYSWSGLARWTSQAIDALGIERCHLVVHDIGGQSVSNGHHSPERVSSLTVLNSPIDVAAFRRPWPMHPFAIRGVGRAWLASMRPPAFGWIFRHVGIADNAAISSAEVDAYVALMKHSDHGNAFLKIVARI